MSESVVERVKRLFPDAAVVVSGGSLRVEMSGHVCWIDRAEAEPLDDLDTTYLVAALLKGLQR